MNELRQLLQDKLGWLESTRGAKHVSVKLDANQLARIMSALREAESKSDLPRIEPRMLGPQEPRGTNRSPEEAAKMYAEIQANAEKYAQEWVAILRAEA